MSENKSPRPTATTGADGAAEANSASAPTGADNKSTTRAILRMLGLARRARRLAVGTDSVLNAARSGKAALVVLASDSSERTKKQIGDKCAAYGVPLVAPDADRQTLADALGFKDGQISACAVTDRNMAIKIQSLTNT